jgi:hypothetical protein
MAGVWRAYGRTRTLRPGRADRRAGGRARPTDYKKTSLRRHMALFNEFLAGLEAANRAAREQQRGACARALRLHEPGLKLTGRGRRSGRCDDVLKGRPAPTASCTVWNRATDEPWAWSLFSLTTRYGRLHWAHPQMHALPGSLEAQVAVRKAHVIEQCLDRCRHSIPHSPHGKQSLRSGRLARPAHLRDCGHCGRGCGSGQTGLSPSAPPPPLPPRALAGVRSIESRTRWRTGALVPSMLMCLFQPLSLLNNGAR